PHIHPLSAAAYHTTPRLATPPPLPSVAPTTLCSSSFLLTHPPPSSTLFPYTTLFRSYLIPIAWTTTIPASALTGRLRPEIALAAGLVAGLAFALARALWRAALKRYAGASG